MLVEHMPIISHPLSNSISKTSKRTIGDVQIGANVPETVLSFWHGRI